MSNFKLEAGPGDHFDRVAEKAKLISQSRNVTVEFIFNEIVCIVDSKTHLPWLYRDYSNAHLMEWKTVGPDCSGEYDIDTEVELRTRQLEQAKKRKRQYDEWAKKDAEEKEKVNKIVDGIVLLIHSDKVDEYAAYVEKNSGDGYSRAVIDYAEAWAKIMQIKMSGGRTEIAAIADESQKDLGFLGITGFQYGCAVNALSHFWIFGAELKDWHNSKYGVKSDNGVVNPAILTLKTN